MDTLTWCTVPFITGILCMSQDEERERLLRQSMTIYDAKMEAI